MFTNTLHPHLTYMRSQAAPFWRRWVVANALAEFVGLGATALLGLLLFRLFADLNIFILALTIILAGTVLEGVLVGYAQWYVLRDLCQMLTARAWMAATALGAATAWLLGMLPSTLISLGENAAPAEPTPEISLWLVLALAAIMGFVLGPVLGYAQWWVLRRHMWRAGWWLLANALAWSAGMVLVFAGSAAIPETGPTLWTVLLLVVSLLLAGAVVGAIHGLFLIRVLAPKR